MDNRLLATIINTIGGISVLLILPWDVWIRRWIDGISLQVEIRKPNEITDQDWNALVGNTNGEAQNQYQQEHGSEGAVVIGRLERYLFFLAFVFVVPELIFAWFAFKVASKWESWSNLIRVPNHLEGINDLEWLTARNRWGTRTYQRFLIGTLLNFVPALLGFLVYYLLTESGFTLSLLR